MSVVLVVLHVFVCIFLIAVVLLQRGRGAEIGAVFGGGASSTGFGARRAGQLLPQPDIDGALVGGASLDPEAFARIVRFQAPEETR